MYKRILNNVFVLLLLIMHQQITFAQIITTVAGGATCGNCGDGGPATSAGFGGPFGVCLDPNGNIYVSDAQNNRVRKVDASTGIITAFAGIGGVGGYSGDGSLATAAKLADPIGVIYYGGNIYIADNGTAHMRMVSASGIISTIAGDGTYGFAGDGGLATSAQFRSAGMMAFDVAGNMYITDSDNHRIRMINASGIINTIVGNGTQGFSGDGGQALAAELNLPTSVAIDGTGNLYFTDASNNRVRMVNTSGIITTIAGNGLQGYGGDGGPATSAKLHNPNGIVLDAAGNIYFSDTYNYRVRKINTAGIITTIAGNGFNSYGGDGGPATAAGLDDPSELAFDTSGNLYIADALNYVIRKVTNVAQVGIEKFRIQNSEFRIYPNPARETINVECSGITEIEVTDLLGNKLIKHATLTFQQKQTINISSLSEGVYVIIIKTAFGTEIKKIIKN